jgi:cell division protein FtsB
MISLIPFPYKILIIVGLLLGVLIFGYTKGHSQGSASVQQKWDADRVAAANAAILAVEQAQKKAQEERIELFKQGQEAVQQAAEELARAKQNALAWEQRYRQALKTPECEKWSKELVQCPLQ